ncbi:MAG TPA: N-acetyltransferase [Symbiobacteriaceae bacterium]|nr:N-acetyltransferase [Symbiobacteriaceae bacterium]
MLTIRTETPADYSAIAALHYETFLANNPDNPFVVEPLMVDLLRHNEGFDPELSIVAELDGQVVGHTLFSPFGFIVLGETLPGVMVAPVAVHPAHQGQKIGAAIMAEGHKRATAKGYALSLLCGHSDYYPRFGYLTAVYALGGSRLTVETPACDAATWAERPLQAADLDWINAGWSRLHANDGLALNPGTGLSQWMGHGPGVQTRVLTENGEPVAYVRYTSEGQALRIRELVLAKGELAAPLAFLSQRLQATKLHLPFPASTLTLDWAAQVEDVQTGHPPFMVKPLTEDGPINRYCEQVLAGALKPSIITFPALFDIEG